MASCSSFEALVADSCGRGFQTKNMHRHQPQTMGSVDKGVGSTSI